MSHGEKSERRSLYAVGWVRLYTVPLLLQENGIGEEPSQPQEATLTPPAPRATPLHFPSKAAKVSSLPVGAPSESVEWPSEEIHELE